MTTTPQMPDDEDAIIPRDRPNEAAHPVVPDDAQAQGLEPMTEGVQAPGIGQMAGTPRQAGSAQMTSNPEVRVGMEVVTSDGAHLGQIKAIRERDVVVDRPMHRDLTVPFKALSLIGDQVLLTLPADQAESLGWDQSSIM